MGRFRPGGKARDTDKGEISQISTASTQSATVGRPEGKTVRSHTCTLCAALERQCGLANAEYFNGSNPHTRQHSLTQGQQLAPTYTHGVQGSSAQYL